MAFKLFDDMKRRGAPIKEAWYTSLFNACANSPWDSERNLVRIEKVRANMSYKGYAPNQTHYHSMIKGNISFYEHFFVLQIDLCIA